MASNLISEALPQLLRGDTGFTGPLGLLEFPSAADKIKASFQTLVIQVDPKSARPQALAVAGGRLVVTLALNVLNSPRLNGVHFEVEDALQLRSLKLGAPFNYPTPIDSFTSLCDC